MLVDNERIKHNNEIFEKAGFDISSDELPIKIIKQGGPFLQEYEEFREKDYYLNLCTDADIVSDIIAQAAETHDCNNGIVVCTDISFIPKALGMEVETKAGSLPFLPKPVTVENMDELTKKGAIDKLRFITDIIKATLTKLEPIKARLIGYSESPWTLLSYMIEGERYASHDKSKEFLNAHPVECIKLLDILTDVIINYLVLQVESGLKVLLVFDYTTMTRPHYLKFGLPYLKRIRESVKEKLKQKELDPIPIILFTRNAKFCFDEQARMGYEIISTNWRAEPQVVRMLLSHDNLIVQENVDRFDEKAEKLIEVLKDLIKQFESQRYVINLGPGMFADIDIKTVKSFNDIVHSIPHKCC